MKIKHSKGENIFNVFNIVLMCCVLIITLYPFYYCFIASISAGMQIVRGNVIFTPVDMTWAAYGQIPGISYFFTSYANTFYYAIFGTLTSLVVMTLGAYALSRKRLKFRRFFGFFISFTLWFRAGIIPFYLNMDSLGLLNSRIGLLIGFAVNAFYIIIMRTYFEGIPVELEEAARVDGLGNFGIFRKIFLPLSTPMLATITLYCAIDRWNGYFWAMILLTDIKKAPLQVLLKKIIIENEVSLAMSDTGSMDYTRESLVYAIIVVSIIPMLIIYPFIQKYFVKGLTVGAVKG